MSQETLAFLQNSFLSSRRSRENEYKNYSDDQIVHELEKYRQIYASDEYAIGSFPTRNSLDLRATIEEVRGFPGEKDIKQLLMYMDQIIIQDPLTAIALDSSSSNLSFNKALGLRSDGSIDRRGIINAVSSIGLIQKAIEESIVILAPSAYMSLEKEHIPLKYSDTAFSGILPPEVEEYYRSISLVKNMHRGDGVLKIAQREPLTIGDLISVSFGEDELGMGYCYMGAKATAINGNEVSMRLVPGGGLTEEVFETWVNQSVNQAAIKRFQQIANETIFAHENSALYMARRTSTAGLLELISSKENREQILANLTMDIELPALDDIPLDVLIDIRNNYGDAFYAFRSSLKEQLNKIDYSKEREEIARDINEIQYGITHTEVEKINQACNNIRRKIKYDSVALVGSLAYTALGDGVSLPGIFLAAMKTFFDVSKYSAETKGSSGYFMWKINQQSKKYKI